MKSESDVLSLMIEGLLSPVYFLFEPSQRLFWVFILSSILLAFWVLYKVNRVTPLGYMKNEFSHDLQSLIQHPSVRFDVLLMLFNRVLKLLIFIPIIGGHLAVAIWVTKFLYQSFGDPGAVAASTFWVITLFTVILFLVEDFSRFFLHFLMHRVPFLWQFHKTHHSAEILTPFSLYRSHPVEVFLFSIRSVLVVGGVSGLFVYLFQGKITGWQILGVDAFGFLFNFMGANLRHSSIWLSFGRLEKWFISPAQHQIHHSTAQIHWNKNYGVCLAIWDRCFQSWFPSGERPKDGIHYGLGGQSSPINPNSFKSLLIPFKWMWIKK